MKKVKQNLGTAHPKFWPIRDDWLKWQLVFIPHCGAILFIMAFFAWPWEGRQAFVGITMVEVVFDIMFQSFIVPKVVVAIGPFVAYSIIRDGKWMLSKLEPEGEASMAARLLLIAMGSPFIILAFFALLPLVVSLVFIFVLWMGAGQLSDSLALLPGFGGEAFKQMLWVVNICLLHGVVGVLLVWAGANARRKWWLGLKQKGLNLACLGMFLVLYWQFSEHYGVRFADIYQIYLYDPEVTMGAIAISLLFLMCSTVVFGFLSMRSISSSLKNVEQIEFSTLSARTNRNISEKERKLFAKVTWQLLVWSSVFYTFYLLGKSYW